MAGRQEDVHQSRRPELQVEAAVYRYCEKRCALDVCTETESCHRSTVESGRCDAQKLITQMATTTEFARMTRTLNTVKIPTVLLTLKLAAMQAEAMLGIGTRAMATMTRKMHQED